MVLAYDQFMITVPTPIFQDLSARIGIKPDLLNHIGGGDGSSDGIVYAFELPSGPRVMKIIHLPAGLVQRTFEERLRFVHFLGEAGVDIVYPISLEDGELFISSGEGDQRFAAYIMPRIQGEHLKPGLFPPGFAFHYGRAIGKLHRSFYERL